MTREIVLDTETTGLDPSVDRIVEIGCVELIDGIRTGRTFRSYINPCRDVPFGAYKVHGLSRKFLSSKPLFAHIADELLEFIGDATLVMHNAAFDLGFLNSELRRADRPVIDDKHEIVDTLAMAKEKLPGAKLSLDALCRRFSVDMSKRIKHGALTDALLLADVYIELNGGRQAALDVSEVQKQLRTIDGISQSEWIPRVVYPTAAELAAHQAFMATISNAIWVEKLAST